MNGVGAVIGPIVAGAMMGAAGETAPYWWLVATHGLIAMFVIVRVISEDAVALSRQGPFVPVPARASEFAIRLTSRPLRASRERLRQRSER